MKLKFRYTSPGAIIKAAFTSQEDLIDTLKDITVSNRGTRKLGIALAKR